MMKTVLMIILTLILLIGCIPSQAEENYTNLKLFILNMQSGSWTTTESLSKVESYWSKKSNDEISDLIDFVNSQPENREMHSIMINLLESIKSNDRTRIWIIVDSLCSKS